MTQEEKYYADMEQAQMEEHWQQWEEEVGEPAKVISIAFHDRELKAVIIEPQKIEDGKDNF